MTRKAPDEWEWKPHLRPIYRQFAELVLSELGQYRGFVLTGLPEPIEDPLLIPDGDLSSTYATLNDREDVKRFGKFDTPPQVVSYMLRWLGYPGRQDGPLLNPACGTGAFLVEVARRYLFANPGPRWKDLTQDIVPMMVEQKVQCSDK